MFPNAPTRGDEGGSTCCITPLKDEALTPQRLARRAQRRLRAGGGERRLRAVERRLALRVKQAGER